MPNKEYSVELAKILSELEDPDAKRPRLHRFQELDQEEREIYMKAVKKQPEPKVDAPLNPQDKIIDQQSDGGETEDI